MCGPVQRDARVRHAGIDRLRCSDSDSGLAHCKKNIRIITYILWRVFRILTEINCGPALRYSVDLRIQTYAEPVSLKCGKLATQNIRSYTDIFYSAAALHVGRRRTRACH